MDEYSYKLCPKTGRKILVTKLTGKALMSISQTNKGTAFSLRERRLFGLLGKLPDKVETISEQMSRAYKQLNSYTNPIKKNLFLYSLLNNNQTLFFALLKMHFEELLPFVYTPVIGEAVLAFCSEYRNSRGLYIGYNDIDNIDAILSNRTNRSIKVIVVTDGEGVLGIGDQGVGGIDIAIAKLMLYTLCAGIDPSETLPICLDVGTNNTNLLNDPYYLGIRNVRQTGKKYDDFISKFIDAVNRNLPGTLLHWERFFQRQCL